VVLSSFSRNDNGATYAITMQFDPALFSETSDVTLMVPNISTRTSSQAGTQLFKKSAEAGQ